MAKRPNSLRQRPKYSAPRKRRKLLPDLAITLILLGMIAALTNYLSPAPQSPNVSPKHWQGSAYIIDGDTLDLNKTRIRMQGIDAPELKQDCHNSEGAYACGIMARDALRQIIGKQPVRCNGSNYDQYGRELARCFIGDLDLNRWMVEQGHAVSYYDYRAQETSARLEKRGIWAGQFQRPQDWRKANPRQN